MTAIPTETAKRLRRVALLIETSSSWGSQIIAGVSDYIRRHHAAPDAAERWTLYVDTRGYFEVPELPAWWKGDGVIARVTSSNLIEQLRTAQVPCVNVSQVFPPGLAMQQVTSNQVQIGALAAQTLIRTGVKHFAYYGPPKRSFYTDEISRSFAGTLKDAGLPAPAQFDPDRVLRSDNSPHDLLGPLSAWLEALPKPVGVLTWNYLGGQRVCEACCFAGLQVPNPVAVLSADYDQLISDICDPPLSCIDQAPRRVGYLAAAELERLLDGGTVEEPKLISPAGIIWKETVPGEHLHDELVREAICLINERLSSPISINELCSTLSVSRRKLELHFRRSLGQGPVARIQLMRIRLACQLLAETNLLVKQIALRCGFRNSEQLQRLLRIESAMTPLQYREAHRRPPRGATPPVVMPIQAGP
jgi:LacI family transcriptional regulator